MLLSIVKHTVFGLIYIYIFLFSFFMNLGIYIYIYIYILSFFPFFFFLFSFLNLGTWMLLPNACYHCEMYPVLFLELLYTEFFKNLTRLNNFFNNESWTYDLHKIPRYFTNLCAIRESPKLSNEIQREFLQYEDCVWNKHTKRDVLLVNREGQMIIKSIYGWTC